MKKYAGIALFIVLFAFFALPLVTNAQGLALQCGGTGQPACEFCHLFTLIQNIINFVLKIIVIPLATLLVVVGGFFIFLGGTGDQKKLDQGKKVLTSVAVGLIIIYGAYIFINTFFTVIGVAEWNGFSLKDSWWNIPSCTFQLTPP